MRTRSLSILGRSVSSVAAARAVPLAAARVSEINHQRPSVATIGGVYQQQRHQGFLSPTSSHFCYSSLAERLDLEKPDGRRLLRAFQLQEKCMEEIFRFYYALFQDVKFRYHVIMTNNKMQMNHIMDYVREWGQRYLHLTELFSPSGYDKHIFYVSMESMERGAVDPVFFCHYKCMHTMNLIQPITSEKAYHDLLVLMSRFNPPAEKSAEATRHFNKYFPYELQQDKCEKENKILLTREHGDNVINVEVYAKGEVSDCVMALEVDVCGKNRGNIKRYEYRVEPTEFETQISIESVSTRAFDDDQETPHELRDFTKESERNYNLYLKDIGITPTLIHILWADTFKEFSSHEEVACDEEFSSHENESDVSPVPADQSIPNVKNTKYFRFELEQDNNEKSKILLTREYEDNVIDVEVSVKGHELDEGMGLVVNVSKKSSCNVTRS